jgi:hypothetical protein
MIHRFQMALVLVLAITVSIGAQARVASISGRVQAPDGSPAAGVRVAAMAAGDLIAFTLTDNSGRYRIDDVPPGRYLIAAGLIGSFTYLPGTTDESKATTVSVTAGSTTDNLNFKLAVAAGVRIRGIVGIPAGNFPRTRQATLNGRTLQPPQSIEPVDALVREDGSFEFRGIMPGIYTIEFSPTGQELNLTVSDANIDNIQVKAPAVITGRVRVEDGGPALTSPAQVNASSTFLRIAMIPPDGSGYSYHPVTRNGTFAFTVPADIAYGVEVYDLPIGYYVKSIRSLNDSRAPKEIDIVLTKQRPVTEPGGVTVRGRVTANIQAIPPSLQVVLTMTPPLYNSGVRVESDGSFVFHDVQPGNYTARIPMPGRLALSTAVVVGNTNIDDLKFVIESEISLNIRVRLANGNPSAPLPTLGVRFSRSDGRNFRSVANRDGTLMATLPEGTYQIALGSLPARYILESMTYGSADARESLTVDPSDPPSDLVITLRDGEN